MPGVAVARRLCGYPRRVPESPPRAAVVILAAGEGQRVGADTNKVLLPLAGLPVFGWSVRAIQDLEYVDRVVVVVREQDRELVERKLNEHFAGFEVSVVVGGSTRHGSEWNALSVLAPDIDAGVIDVVAIHDAARPLATSRLFTDVVEAARLRGGALPVLHQSSLIPRAGGPAQASEVARGQGRPEAATLVGVQTPQAFRAAPLLEAYRHADRDGFVGTDTASCLERFTGTEIRCVPSDAANLKITFPEDVMLAERLLENRGPSC